MTVDQSGGGEIKADHGLLDGTDDERQTAIDNSHKDPSNSYIRSTRWKVAYMGFFFGVMSYVYRVNISIALPFMVKSTPQSMTSRPLSNETDVYFPYNHSTVLNASMDITDMEKDGECQEIGAALSESLSAEFSWSKQTQGLVLSSFYYGYLFQFPFGWLAGKYGGKHIISVAMAMSAVLTLLLPVLARWSVYAVVVVRIMLGFCSGATLTAWYKLLSHWALPYERSRFVSMCWFGQISGTIFGFFTSGFLCAHGFDNGWGSVFYIHGIIGVVFVVLWLYIVYESPDVHPRISEAELKLLTSQLHTVNKVSNRQLSVPWRQMFLYKPVLAVYFTHIMENFVFYTVLSCLPLYMKDILKFDIQNNGIFSALPFITGAVGLMISGFLGDHVISKQLLSPTTTRKLAQVVGHLGAAVFILVPGFLSCDQRMWVIVCLCVCMWFDGIGQGSGFACSPVDIAPRFASIIFGISNSLATTAGIVTPMLVGELTPNDTAEEWRSVFLIATAAAVLGALVFGIFSSSDLAPWATERSLEVVVGEERSGTYLIKETHIGNDQT